VSSTQDPHAHDAHGGHGHAAAPEEKDPLWLAKGLVMTAATGLFVWAIFRVGMPAGMPRGWQAPMPSAPWTQASTGHGGSQAPEHGAAPAHGAEASPLGAMTERALPGGAQVRFPEKGVEGALLAFVTDPARQVDKETWFDFDRLVFVTGSAAIRPDSQEQLSAVAEILRAFPQVKLKVGGYTDNVGDPALNQRLSEERAATVRGALLNLGIAPDRLAAEGYGERFPVGDNATAEGRARNRRISMRVTDK